MSLTQIIDHIRTNPRTLKTQLIAVDGEAGSGKSTFARLLARYLNCPIVEIDDFLSWGDLTSWWPRFETQVVLPLLAGEPAKFQTRDWENHWAGNGLKDWKVVPWNPVLIIEGVGSSRREISDRLSLAVWVDASVEVRLSRGLARDSHMSDAADLWENWMKIESEFFKNDPCQDRADFVIGGETDSLAESKELRILKSELT